MIDLVTRRKFFDEYADRIGEVPPALKQYGIRFTCPCCGYPTLRQRGLDEICFLCGWEDDGQDDEDADVVRGFVNGEYSLDRARENFVKYLVKYEPENDRRIGGADSPEELAEKRKIIDAFEAMRTADDHHAHWETVRAAERALWERTKDRIRSL